jgi:squalene synthase HpnC
MTASSDLTRAATRPRKARAGESHASITAVTSNHSPRTGPQRGDTGAVENGPVALRILPARHRRDLLAIDTYARHVDTLGDAAAGDRRAALCQLADEVDALIAGRVVRDPVVAGLAGLVARGRVPAGPLLALIQANLTDQDVHRYGSFEDLLGYCRCSADPVGELVLYAFDSATPERVRLSNRICTGLQLIEHWQDIGEDYAAGRVYLPQEDMARYGVSEADLGRAGAGPRLRALLAFETDRALAWLDAGAVLTATLPRWGRLAVSGYLAGGRAAAARLRAADYDPLPAPRKPRGRDVAAAWAIAKVRLPG